MAEKSDKRKGWVAPAAGGTGAVVIAAAQIRPEEAMSNLGGWLKMLGIDELPSFFATSGADALATYVGLTMVLSALLYRLWPRKKATMFDQKALDGLQRVMSGEPAPPRKTVWDRARDMLNRSQQGSMLRLMKAKNEEQDAQTYKSGWKDSTTERVPFVRIRHDAARYGLILDPRDPTSSNVAYEVEGALRQAAVDGDIKVWGRKYHGPVKDNDPLVPIPKEHFEDYSFRHGVLNYDEPNVRSGTATIRMLTLGTEGVPGVTYYDLHLSFGDLRSVLKAFAERKNDEQT